MLSGVDCNSNVIIIIIMIDNGLDNSLRFTISQSKGLAFKNKQKHLMRIDISSLPRCCALSWRGGLCALGTTRAMMAGAYAPGRLNYAGLLQGRRARLNSTLVLQVGGLVQG